jgi:HK97 family phage major capsid protein
LFLAAETQPAVSIPLELRRTREGVVVLRASNDTVVDRYGTVITVEALHDWWEGYQQHRTVNLQHNVRELRGIRGKPMIGVAIAADFTPQLELTVRVFDDEANRLIDERRITAGSLEFVPEGEEERTIGGQQARVYHRLANEPELTGLALVDIPGVPGADILERRTLAPNWAYAVVDPRVLSGDITDPALIEQLRWLPHHDLDTRLTSPEMLERAYAELERITVPVEASLTRAQIIQRAREHLDRHARLGLLSSRTMEVMVNENPETNQATASERVQPRWDAEHGRFVPVVVNVHPAPETRSAPEQLEADEAQQPEASQNDANEASEVALEQRVQQAVDARIQALMRQPENPMAAIAAGLRVRSQRMEPEQILEEVIAATVLPQIQRRALDSDRVQRLYNILREHGISERALSIEANGTVIYEEMARQFVVRPAPDIVFRNHMRSLPMAGTKKADFPRFSRAGLSWQWNRSSAVGAGSTTDITTSEPTLDTFAIEVTELNGAVPVTDGFLQFNASGPTFVQQYLLPEMRAAAQYEEDRAFFLSTGTHPQPATFAGLRYATGVTEIPAGANGDPFTEDMLNSLMRAMPVAFRGNPDQLAFYLPVSLADDLLTLRSRRETGLGDRTLERDYNRPGPQPVAFYRGVPVFAVPQLPTDEVQGTADNAATIYLLHREQPVIGDALTIRIEPYRRSGFQTLIQLQEFVGLGYQWPEAIVRRSGVLPAVL